MLQLEYPEGRPSESALWPDAAADDAVRDVVSLGGRRWAVIMGEDVGYTERPRLAVFDGTALTAGPEDLGAASRLAFIDGSLWAVGFEILEDDLVGSRLRVTRRDPADLSRVEPDRWADGWGGLRPVAFDLVTFGGAPWLVWVTSDARYDERVVHALPLAGPACGRAVSEAVQVTMIGAREGSWLDAAFAATADRIAVVVKDASRLEVTSLRACGP